MKKLFLTVACIFSIFVILSSPQIIASGVRLGIKLNLHSVIPALLPFMVLTNIMMKYNLCEYISFIFYPILSKFFKISKNGCFAAIIGFTCGYPMGAKIIGDLYSSKLICDSEAQYLITFCNNCSISFLLNYIAFNCLAPAIETPKILVLVYFPPLISGFINKFILKPEIKPTLNSKYSPSCTNPITSAIKSISILSVYIICFTVISNYIASLHFIPLDIKCISAGLFEITSGSKLISSMPKVNLPKNFLILVFTVFGGFSIMFQSFATLSETSLKKYYIIGKIEQLIIMCLLYILIL